MTIENYSMIYETLMNRLYRGTVKPRNDFFKGDFDALVYSENGLKYKGFSSAEQQLKKIKYDLLKGLNRINGPRKCKPLHENKERILEEIEYANSAKELIPIIEELLKLTHNLK